MAPVRVVYLLNEASETSIPLEVAASLDAPDLEVDVCSFFEPAADTFGVDVYWLGATSQLDPRAYARFVRFVRRRDADVVHVHPNGTGSVIRALLAPTDVGLVTTEHTDHRSFSRPKRAVNGITNALSDVIVVNSNATRESLYGWERWLASRMESRITVIHNGVDVDGTAGQAGSGLAPELPDGVVLGTVGRMVKAKRQDALLRASRRLIEDRDDVHLVLGGDGPLRSDLEALADELGIADRVRFLGRLSERRAAHLVMDGLDVFAFPSEFEGFGVAVAEAMALETPVVANDLPVLREIVGDAGVLVDTTDIDAFAGALEGLLDERGRRERLARRGRNRISEEFPLSATVSAHEELYAGLARGDG